MMIPTLGVLTRIFMIFHVKSTNQRLCNGLMFEALHFWLNLKTLSLPFTAQHPSTLPYVCSHLNLFDLHVRSRIRPNSLQKNWNNRGKDGVISHREYIYGRKSDISLKRRRTLLTLTEMPKEQF